MDFITCKEDLTQVTNFNISRRRDAEVHGGGEGGRRATTSSTRATARSSASSTRATVWDSMIVGAWRTGEPGVFFIDEANRYNPVPHLGSYEATNPCGEQPLLPYDVCNLGSHQRRATTCTTTARRWTGTRFAQRHPPLARTSSTTSSTSTSIRSPEIDDALQAHPPHRTRRDGLRRRARAARHRRTTRDEGVEFGRKVMEFVDVEAKTESERLAERARRRSPSGRRASGARTRPARATRTASASVRCSCSATATSTTVAPTGTISIIAGCSSGLEPLFAVAFMRNQAGVMMPDVNEDFVAIAKREGWYTEELMERIAEDGPHRTSPRCPTKWQRVFVTANDDRARVAHQDAGGLPGALRLGDLQDDATSRTPRPSTTCAKIYEMAYELECKGVTVYRDGCATTRCSPPARRPRRHRRRVPAPGRASSDTEAALAERASGSTGRARDRDRAAQAARTRWRRESCSVARSGSRPDKLRGTTIAQGDARSATMFVNITEDDRGSRSRCSSRSARPAARRWPTPRRWGG